MIVSAPDNCVPINFSPSNGLGGWVTLSNCVAFFLFSYLLFFYLIIVIIIIIIIGLFSIARTICTIHVFTCI